LAYSATLGGLVTLARIYVKLASEFACFNA
jgi:hypothetical protein